MMQLSINHVNLKYVASVDPEFSEIEPRQGLHLVLMFVPCC